MRATLFYKLFLVLEEKLCDEPAPHPYNSERARKPLLPCTAEASASRPLTTRSPALHSGRKGPFLPTATFARALSIRKTNPSPGITGFNFSFKVSSIVQLTAVDVSPRPTGTPSSGRGARQRHRTAVRTTRQRYSSPSEPRCCSYGRPCSRVPLWPHSPAPLCSSEPALLFLPRPGTHFRPGWGGKAVRARGELVYIHRSPLPMQMKAPNPHGLVQKALSSLVRKEPP